MRGTPVSTPSGLASISAAAERSTAPPLSTYDFRAFLPASDSSGFGSVSPSCHQTTAWFVRAALARSFG